MPLNISPVIIHLTKDEIDILSSGTQLELTIIIKTNPDLDEMLKFSRFLGDKDSQRRAILDAEIKFSTNDHILEAKRSAEAVKVGHLDFMNRPIVVGDRVRVLDNLPADNPFYDGLSSGDEGLVIELLPYQEFDAYVAVVEVKHHSVPWRIEVQYLNNLSAPKRNSPDPTRPTALIIPVTITELLTQPFWIERKAEPDRTKNRPDRHPWVPGPPTLMPANVILTEGQAAYITANYTQLPLKSRADFKKPKR